MAQNIKNYLGYALILGVVVVAFSVWQYVGFYGSAIQPSSFRSFAVSGEGKVVAIPDIATFTFSVITEGGKDMTALQNDNTKKINDTLEFITSAGVEKKDMKTEGYSVDPRYQYANCMNGKACPPPEIVGYTITQSVSVKIRDFAKAGEILSGVVSRGANSVSSLVFAIDNPATFEADARAEAIAEAKTKALSVAKAGGFSLGKIISIDEGGNYPMPMPYAMEAYGKGGADVSSPRIEPGSSEVKIKVMVRYEIR